MSLRNFKGDPKNVFAASKTIQLMVLEQTGSRQKAIKACAVTVGQKVTRLTVSTETLITFNLQHVLSEYQLIEITKRRKTKKNEEKVTKKNFGKIGSTSRKSAPIKMNFKKLR